MGENEESMDKRSDQSVSSDHSDDLYSMNDSAGFSKLVFEFSMALINLRSAEFEKELDVWFKRIAEFLDMDRVFIATFSEDKQFFEILQSYCNPEAFLHNPPKRLPLLPSPKAVYERVRQGRVLIVERAEDLLSEEERQSSGVRDAVKSYVSIPLVVPDKVFGILGISSFRAYRRWPEALVTGFKLLGQSIISAILRREHEVALQEEIARSRRFEQRYATILNTTNIGFWISDMNQNILEVNNAACAISGYSREEMILKKITEIDVLNSPEEVEKIRDVLRKHGSGDHETRHRRKDGKIVDLAVSSTLLADEGIIFAFFSDITELKRTRREIEEQLEFETLIADFSAVLINVSRGELENAIEIWMGKLVRFLNVDHCTVTEYAKVATKRRFVFEYIDPNFANVSEVTHAEKPVYGLADLIKGEKYLKIDRIPEDFPEEMPEQFKNRVIEDGTKSLFLVPLRDGNENVGMVLFASFTSEKLWTDHLIRRMTLVAEIISNALVRNRKDVELIRYRDHLEQLVEERTALLEKAQEELIKKEQLATLGKVAATMSHELRNPLGTISSSLYAINQRSLSGQSISQLSIDRAGRSIERCVRILDDLLSFAQIPKLQLIELPIDSWLADVLEKEPVPEGVNLQSQFTSGVFIKIDPERFKPCIINILTNACQGIEQRESQMETGLIQVSTRLNEKFLEIIVADNGVGFDPELKEKIFEPLYSTKNFGVGLGVPIAKQIIERHGGHLFLEGRPGQGTTAVIQMPITGAIQGR